MKIRHSPPVIAVLALFPFNILGAVHCVDLNSSNPVSPYADWSTAATDIQSAVDAANAGDIVLVTNGVYQTGGRLAPSGQTTNRVAVTKAVTVQSINGPAATIIRGYQVPGTTNGASAVRCVYLTNNAVLSGFTLTGGATTYTSDHYGGGIYCKSTSAIVSNCVLTGNAASSGGGACYGTFYNCTISSNGLVSDGGGVVYATLYNCVVAGNSSTYVGGGVEGGNLYNCLVVNNTASSSGGGAYYVNAMVNCTIVGNFAGSEGGGLYEGNATNCIVYFNTGYAETANMFSANGHHCCTTPTNYMAADNFTNAPLFVDRTGGNFRLQTNSPCINTGDLAGVIGTTDLDRRPRVVVGKVDVGAYEFQGAGMGEFISWLQRYGLPTDGSADFTDLDGDGLDNWQEWMADTSPLDGNDCLHITNFTRSGNYNTLWWSSKSTRLYQVQRCAALDPAAPWETIITNSEPGWNNVGFDNTDPQYFYRILAIRP